MSDYVHNKSIRLPFPKEILEKCNTEDPWECESYLKELLGDLWESRKSNSFTLELTNKAFYIDWRYHSTYGDESGEWYRARQLTQLELETIRPYFDKLGVKYNDNDLRAVDYCYYNSCEPMDCYEIESLDDSKLLIN